MILNGANEVDRTKISSTTYDICIVGSGAVGLSMAQRLVNSGKKVVVLESSIKEKARGTGNWWDSPRNKDTCKEIRELDDPAPNQEGSFWYRARSEFFNKARTRCYGGSTNCWGGYFRPLDDYDFERGWPPNLNRTTLDPYYKDALKLVNLNYFDDFDNPSAWLSRTEQTVKPLSIPQLLGARAKTVILMQQIDHNLIDFQIQFNGVFENNENMNLVRNATVVNWEPFSGTLRSVQFAALDTKNEPLLPLAVKAKQYVLAMGGLEIPRFLLSVKWDGNYSCLQYVGKYYMNHPKYSTSAVIKPAKPLQEIFDMETMRFYKPNLPLKGNRNFQIQALVVPTVDGMRQYGTQNFRVALGFFRDNDKETLRDDINIELNFEQVPTENSRLTLDSDKANNDVFGQPRSILDWQFARQDATTVNKSTDLIVDLLTHITGGDCTVANKVTWVFDSDKTPPILDASGNNPYTGDHHMGTCRMNSSDSARDGVVDSNCKVIGFDNLWICSTGVFPSGGWANSTFTLLALALRLADQLIAKEPEDDV